MSLLIAFLALVLERVFGYPDILIGKIGHPVIWQGYLISFLEKKWGGGALSPRGQRSAGIAMLLALILVTGLVAMVLHGVLQYFRFGWIIEAVVASSLLAQKSLGRSVRKVMAGLQENLSAGRAAVSDIVGRDTARLSESEVSRAAIESLAENTSDGVIAPLFWLAIFGLPGIAIYKAINTADSMVGHKNARYLHFGWASARLDDLVNWVPARLTFWLIVLAATQIETARPVRAMQAGYRDADKHVSPNAGWPEAGFAGALDIVLGGERSYGEGQVELAEMGSGRRDLVAGDIELALGLYSQVLNVALGVVGLLALGAGFLILAF